MKLVSVLVLAALAVVIVHAEGDKKAVKSLQIGIKKKVENCSIKSRKGDSLSM